MRVLEEDQHWLLACQFRELALQRAKGLGLSLLWAQLERWIASIRRGRQQRREEAHVFGQRFGRCENFLQLPQPILGAVTAYATSLPFHPHRNWVERAVLVIRRAEVAQTDMLFLGELLLESCQQSRLADSRLPGEQHHSPLTRARLSPPMQKELELFFPTDHRQYGSCVHRLGAAQRPSSSPHSPSPYRLIKSFECKVA